MLKNILQKRQHHEQMVLRTLDVYMQRKETRPGPNSKWIKDLNVFMETLKLV